MGHDYHHQKQNYKQIKPHEFNREIYMTTTKYFFSLVRRISITLWEMIWERHLVSSGFSNDLVHFFNLSQGSLVSTQSLLGQLLGSLLTSVSDQLDQSSLVWGQARNLRHDRSDESSSLGESTLSVRDLWGNLLSGGLVALVQTDSNSLYVSMRWDGRRWKSFFDR